MDCILIGNGEIGKGILESYGKFHNIDVYDITMPEMPDCNKVYDLMLVAIPYSDKFVSIVKEYQIHYAPLATIVFSTVQIGTCSKLENTVHSPIEGKHPHLAESIKKWHPFMGGNNKKAYDFLCTFTPPTVLKFPEHTEAMKMLSTTLYGVMLEYFRYAGTVCNAYDLDFDMFNKYNKEYNALYYSMNMSNFRRPILEPPVGNIGGHCVMPNAAMLDKIHPNTLVKEVYRNKEDKHNVAICPMSGHEYCCNFNFCG